MKSKMFISLGILGLMVASFMSTGLSNSIIPVPVQASQDKTQSDGLTIYTYDSLMADPYYDIAGNFSAYSGINKDNINIVRYSDANVLVSKLISEKDHPQADVVIGIDNALEFLFNLSDVLVPYTNTSVLANIDPSLIQNLDVNNYLVPYDYGIISFYYSNNLVNSTAYPVLNNLTFDNLLQSPLISKIVTENPQISSTGLGFLLWTIGYYGDPNAFVSGLSGKDWTTFWNNGGKNINMTNSWGDAFTVFSDPKADKPMMVSYSTSPAYDNCIYGDNSTSASVTTYLGKEYGWYQIEGAGLVKNSPNQANAKKFMDWFLGNDVQNHIPESQWMYPARTNVTIPACFSQASLNPANVEKLNGFVSPSFLKQYLALWLNEWEQLVVTQGLPGFNASFVIALFPVLSAIVIFRRKKASK